MKPQWILHSRTQIRYLLHMINKKHKQEEYMKKLIGLVALCVAAGMLVMLFMTNRFVGLVLIVLLMLIGYNFFCCD